MAALTGNERARQAEEFLSVAVWKLISFNSTSAKTGTSPRFRMRVFAKGCPRHAIREVHERLARQNPLKDPVIDGVVQPGTYYHRGAGYVKDERTSEAGTATYTIVRDYFDGPVSETDVVEDGCGGKTAIRFEWDREEVEDLETLVNSLGGTGGVSPQGTVVRIAGVNRDQETGLFSYYVTVTETKTVVQPSFTSSADAFFTESESAWLGLRGDEDDPTDHKGTAVAIPEAGVSDPGGTLTQVSWSKNREDCTLNAQVKVRVAKPDVAAAASCVKTLFEERDSAAVRAAASPLSHAPAPSDGKIVSHRDTLRPDNLWDTDKDETRELPVPGARVSTEVTAFETNVVTLSRSLAKGSAPAASASGGVITSPTVEKTPGDRENVTVGVRTELPGPRAVDKSDNAFESSSVTDDVSATALGDPPAAAAGVVTSHSDRRTPGGLFQRRKTVNTEKPGPRSASDSEDRFSEERSEEDVNAAPLGEAPPAAAGVTVAHVDSNTPGGLYARRKTTRVEKPGPRSASDSEDQFSEERSEEDVNAVPLGAAPAAAAGVIVTHSDSNTPGGLFQRRKTTRVEKPGPRSEDKSDNAFESSSVTDDVSATALGDPPAAAAGVVTSHSDRRTPGGLFQRRKTVNTEKTGGRGAVSAKTAFDVTEEEADVALAPLGKAPPAAGGVIVTHSDSNTPGGLVSRRKKTVRETSVEGDSEDTRVTPWGTFLTVTDKSMPVKKSLPAGAFGTVRNSLTPGGMYDRSTTQLVPGSVAAGTVLSHTKGGNKFSTVEVKETVETEKDFGVTGLTNGGVPGEARIREVEFTCQEDGTYRKRETVRTASGKIWIYASYSYTDYNTNKSLPDVTVSVYHYQFLNASEAEAVALLGQSVSGRANVRVSCRMDINEFGLYGGTFHRTVRIES